MKRREFIQISSLSLAALLVDGCDDSREYDITFLNDMAVGHLAFESHAFPITKSIKTKYLIVGGGIAGLSAAYKLQKQDFMLFELSNLLGGSSAGSQFENSHLCHGAHYDLSYPNNFGKDGLNMLQKLGIIRFDQFSRSWKFVDKQYMIPKQIESQTMAHGQIRRDVLPDGAQKTAFVDLMKSFANEMPMPTRLVNEKFRHLNDISFVEWLQQKIELSSDFIEGLDYHMKDDYGAAADEVSALAGIHYFACRPYYTQPVELFSPPQGNSYFINKIYKELPKEKIYTSHLVKRITDKNGGFEVEVVDAQNKEVVKVDCEKIIYAGHKHSLKYIYPRDFSLFHQVQYAPWVVVNIIMEKEWDNNARLQAKKAFWQNEIISDDRSLLGFVDSRSQYKSSEQDRVFTVYYCFKPEEREMMSLIDERKQLFVNQTLDHLERFFDASIKSDVKRVVIKQMGHAMPIPSNGYLFNDANEKRSNPNLTYAGVDNGRLPLLFEAIDSGIQACLALVSI